MANATGQNSTLGYVKETTFGAGGVPAYFPGFETWTPAGKNTGIRRPATKKRQGQSFMVTGPFDFSASLRPEADPEVLFPLLAYFFGAQTTPTAAAYYTTATTGSTAIGATTFPVTPGTGNNALIPATTSIVIDTGANAETLTVAAGSTANNINTSAATKAHASGVAIVAYSSTAYTSTISFAPTIPSLMFEYGRVVDGVDYLGCRLDTLKLGTAPGSLLAADFGIVGSTVLKIAAGALVAPSYPVSFPLAAESAGGMVTYKGVPLTGSTAPVVRKWDASVSNNLDKGFRTIGSRFVPDFPLGARTASGSLVLSLPDGTTFSDFLGGIGATSPQAAINGISLGMTINSQTMADPVKLVPLGMTINFPNAFPLDDAVPGKQTGPLEQTLTFDAAENPGQNNDITISITTATATAY